MEAINFNVDSPNVQTRVVETPMLGSRVQAGSPNSPGVKGYMRARNSTELSLSIVKSETS